MDMHPQENTPSNGQKIKTSRGKPFYPEEDIPPQYIKIQPHGLPQPLKPWLRRRSGREEQMKVPFRALWDCIICQK